MRLTTVAVFLLGAVLRVYGISQQSLWTDDGFSLDHSLCEGLTACIAKLFASEGSEKYSFPFFLILSYWRNLFGDDVTTLRSPSVLFSTLTLPIVWYAARILFDSRHAVWSLAFAATSAFAVYYAHEVRQYSLLIMLTAAQIATHAASMRLPAQRSRKWLFILVTFLTSWASIISLVFTVALCLSDLLARKALHSTMLSWLPPVLTCLPAACYYAFQMLDGSTIGITAQSCNPLYLHLMFVGYAHLMGQTYSVPLVELRDVDPIQVLQHYWPQLALPIGIAAVLAWQIGRMMVMRNTRVRESYAVNYLGFSLIIFVALSLLVAAGTEQTWLPRHAFPVHVLLALLLPEAISGKGWNARSGAAALTALLVLNAVSLDNSYHNPVHWRDDYKGVAAYLNQERAAGRPAIIFNGSSSVFRIYGDSSIDGTNLDRVDLPTRITEVTAGAREVLIVVNRPYLYVSGDPCVNSRASAEDVAAIVAPDYRVVDSRWFHYFVIYRIYQLELDPAAVGPVRAE
jgi:Dolichyl-phosphate-mannose-protein mannosyltransferase